MKTTPLDLENIILCRISSQNNVRKEELDSLFSSMELRIINKLIEEGYLITTWEKQAIYDDCEVVQLTQKGQVRLFKVNNKEEVARFIEILKSMRYDSNLLDDFLMSQDLTLPVWNILDVKLLEDYCQNYDRAINEAGTENIIFTRLKSQKGTIFDEDGKRLMEDLLSVYDNHNISICHPNHLFTGSNPLTKDVRDMFTINWDAIDISKMQRIGDYKSFISPNCQKAFRYVHKRLGHIIMSEINKGNDDVTSYLVVVEEYQFDNATYHLVRGIIKGDKEGYSLGFNPEYQKSIPQSNFERGLRFGDNETPSCYLVKRPQQ